MVLTAPSALAADAQQELEAIRAALVAAAREAPTRVISTAWIDDQGVLREEAFFHSTAQVRGVRVLSYLEEGADRPSLKATAQVALPAHVLAIARPVQGSDGKARAADCPTPQAGQFRHPVSLSIAAQTGARRDDAAVIGLLARATQGWWVRQTPRATRWHPQGQAHTHLPQGQEGPPILVSGSEQGYRRALLGLEHPATPWVIRVQLRAPSEATRPWQIRLSLEKTSDATELLSESLSLTPSRALEGFAGMSVLIGLQGALTDWIAQVDARLACEPPLLEARPTQGSDWSLAVGQASGLKVGQRMLLLDGTRIPARWAEPGGLAELGIAEVAAVHAQHTTLRWLAGPRQSPAGAWLALPL
jgi:hypothetical protein